MIEQDTIKLLRECDAGVKMGISSIEDVLPRTKSKALYHILKDCKTQHDQLHEKIQSRLQRFDDEGKNPNIIAKSMSTMKTTFKLGLNETDATIASLMTDGCNMGVKSLNKYLNEYEAADEVSKDITKRLINLEKQLASEMQAFL